MVENVLFDSASWKVVLFFTDTTVACLHKLSNGWFDANIYYFGRKLLFAIFEQTFKNFRYGNGTCCKVNKEGTDVYFHVVDTKTGKVLPYDHPQVKR